MKKVLALFLLLAVIIVSVFAAGEKETTSVVDDGYWVPKKPITFVIPFEAGGTADVPARIVAKYMNKYSAQPFTVINIPGSGGRVGAHKVMSSAADGYTVLHVPTGWFMQKSMKIADFSYEDFENISLWAQSWLALVVRSDSKYQTFQDLIDDAKSNPGEIMMGGVSGTLPILAELTLIARTNIDVNMVSIDANAKAAELLSGRIDCYVDGFGALKPYIDSGNFKCLGVFSDNPLLGYESIPLMKNIGVADTEFLNQSFGMWAPKGTPQAALEYINNVIRQAANDPECAQELAKISYAPLHTTMEEYAKLLVKTQRDTDVAVKPMMEAK